MRLLPPQQLNTRLNEQKKSEAEAGMFLAKKVDALREQVSEAELEYEFVIKGIKSEEIRLFGEFATKKESLEKEISSLTVKRNELLEPLDAEWNKVNELIEKTNETIRIHDAKRRELTDRESVIKRKEREIKEAKTGAENSLSEIKKTKEEIRKVLILREQELFKANSERMEYQKEFERSLLVVGEKERRLTYEIKHYQDFSKHLKEKEKGLNSREVKLSIKENAKHN